MLCPGCGSNPARVAEWREVVRHEWAIHDFERRRRLFGFCDVCAAPWRLVGAHSYSPSCKCWRGVVPVLMV